MKKAFKFRLHPNKTTEQKLYDILNRCRELYNAAVSERKDAYQHGQHIAYHVNEETGTIVATIVETGKSLRTVTRYGQNHDLLAIKEDRPEYKDIGAHVLQDVIHRVDLAFVAFFRRVAQGQTPGYPRFRSRNRYDSFTYPDQWGWKLDGNHLNLSKIGSIKVKLHRPIEGKIKTVTIKREGDHWYVVFCCEVGVPEKLPVSYEDVGIDLGVTHLATLSNGEMIEHPRYYRRAEKQLGKRQQAISRKKHGSHRRKKAVKLVGKAHRRTARQRRDFLHKESRKLVNRYQVIVFEDIQTANLVKRPKPKQSEKPNEYLPNGAAVKAGLNKSINDAGWGMFIQMCASKAEEAGRTIVKVDPKFTSQVCSDCGQVRKKDLSERWHSCECGAELDRDVNAAINILTLGKKQLARKEPTRATA